MILLCFLIRLPVHSHMCTGGSDYEARHYAVSFPAGVNLASFKVTISNDKIVECVERFTVSLEIPSAATTMGAIKGLTDTATVTIMDEDGG